jgi:beta-lysine 5,6-aminomutase alpha subunit
VDPKLAVNAQLADRCRAAARRIADDVDALIAGATSVTVERTIARLLGVDGVDRNGVPLPNVLVDQLGRAGRTGDGLFHWIGNAVIATGLTPQELAVTAAREELSITSFESNDTERIERALEQAVGAALARFERTRTERERRQQTSPSGPQPWLYVIVATGDIYEDVVQARAAVRQGADIIAVIRSTAQSLLDYVPYGPTTEGFGGTFATQENFRIMRGALDEVGEQVGRYIRLVNYASGLCMPEISVMGAFERLDMMLNDSMYGILFRDINPRRTLIDQRFSRLINASADIIINTGEDNYLTTSDAVEEFHTVLASQFINKELANRTGMPDRLIGLGHAFEIDPDLPNGFLLELAHAQLVRQLFPDCPIKYMPPTRHMTGNIFRGHVQDALFNLAGIMSGQSIQLLGMMTEAVHTPFLQDRALSLENARYIMNGARDLANEITYSRDGLIQRRADRVLSQAAEMLEDIAASGLIRTIELGRFAGICRPAAGGKGAEGVAEKTGAYMNPFAKLFSRKVESHAD